MRSKVLLPIVGGAFVVLLALWLSVQKVPVNNPQPQPSVSTPEPTVSEPETNNVIVVTGNVTPM